MHQLSSFFLRVTVKSDIWEICLTSAWPSTDLESFAFEMDSDQWVNDDHRPRANAGNIFISLGQIFVSLENVKSGMALSFTLKSPTELIAFFQMGSVSMAFCLLPKNKLGVEDGGQRGDKVCSYVGKYEGLGFMAKELNFLKIAL